MLYHKEDLLFAIEKNKFTEAKLFQIQLCIDFGMLMHHVPEHALNSLRGDIQFVLEEAIHECLTKLNIKENHLITQISFQGFPVVEMRNWHSLTQVVKGKLKEQKYNGICSVVGRVFNIKGKILKPRLNLLECFNRDCNLHQVSIEVNHLLWSSKQIREFDSRCKGCLSKLVVAERITDEWNVVEIHSSSYDSVYTVHLKEKPRIGEHLTVTGYLRRDYLMAPFLQEAERKKVHNSLTFSGTEYSDLENILTISTFEKMSVLIVTDEIPVLNMFFRKAKPCYFSYGTKDMKTGF